MQLSVILRGKWLWKSANPSKFKGNDDAVGAQRMKAVQALATQRLVERFCLLKYLLNFAQDVVDSEDEGNYRSGCIDNMPGEAVSVVTWIAIEISPTPNVE
jgi:lysozyme family protein